MNLSLILCSRNDAYMGNSLWRLETTLNYVGERVQALGRASDVEVLVTDWGSDVPLREVVRLGPAAKAIVSFVSVPPSLAASLQGDSPFPEVLALNAAARRARGRYIGRIDQDTLVGERFLRWFFDTVANDRPMASGVMPDDALFFANRRDIPYRVTERSPGLRNVTSFVRWCGDVLPVWRENPATGDVFWTSAVGIWIAHRNLWRECGGYDERLIYYNWMETDMICRLRQTHAIVDVGALTDYDFYHLEHFDPRTAWFSRPHALKNEAVDPTAPATVLHPNSDAWGLRAYDLPAETASGSASIDLSGFFPLLMLRLAIDMAIDRIVVLWIAQRQVLRRRYARVRREVTSQALAHWPGLLWALWNGRHQARIRSGAGLRGFGARKALMAAISALGLLVLRGGFACDLPSP